MGRAEIQKTLEDAYHVDEGNSWFGNNDSYNAKNAEARARAQNEANDIVNKFTLSDTNLMPGQRVLDPETQGLISEGVKRASGPSSLLGDEYLRGVDEQGGLIKKPEEITRGYSSLGMKVPDDFGNALTSIGQKKFGASMDNLKRSAYYQAELDKSNELATYGKALSANERLRIQNYEQQKQFVQQRQALNQQLRQAKEQGRSSVLGGILGGLATIGAALLGGPIGAAAGAALGGTAGATAGNVVGNAVA